MNLGPCGHMESSDIELTHDQRSKLGQKGQKGQISEIVANCLKHMENRYFIEKTCFNYFLKFFIYS